MQSGALFAFRSDDDMTFLHAEKVLGLQSEVAYAQRLACIFNQFPECLHKRRGNMKLKREFPHKPQAHDSDRNCVPYGKFTVSGKGECGI